MYCELWFSTSDSVDDVTDTFHIEPMLPITTSFQRSSSSSSSSSLLSPRHGGTCPPDLLTSSLGRRPAVCRQLTPPCGVVTTASRLHHLRRNSFTATATALQQGSVLLTLSPPILLRLYTLPYWSNPPFLIFDIRALWRQSARISKIKNGGLYQYGAGPYEQ